jgi:hypothetical protein
MNERIRQLATQAGEEIKAEYEDESRRNRRLYNEIFLPKFAQLIVRECVGIADEYDGAGSTIVSRIEKHFGVEE